MNLSTI